MMWMLSPAEFVWMILSFGGAANRETDAAHKAIPNKTMMQPRNTGLFVIFVISSFQPQSIPMGPTSGNRGRAPSTARAVARATIVSLQTPMLSMSTTQGCPSIQSACLRHEPDHPPPLRQADG